ncbi:MAG: M15 family metallopeptidase [Pseudomonadota bacterium]
MADPAKFSPLELTGRARTHVVELEEPRCTLHRDVVQPFLALRAAAATAGIDLVAVSSFRDFQRQQLIWNGKCRGERELLDREGLRMDPAQLDPDGLVYAILLWSALPGASRHHWGTDMDVIDAAAIAVGQAVRLEPAQYAPGGCFGRLNQWLDQNAMKYGFYRPYAVDRGGVHPEPWHLSFAPVAQQALAEFSIEVLDDALASEGIDALDAVRRHLPEIVARYVRNVDVMRDAPPAELIPGTRLA